MMTNADRLTRWIAIAVIVSLAGLSVACGTLQESATIATPGSATDAVARNAIEGSGQRPDPTAIAVPEPTATPTREATPTDIVPALTPTPRPSQQLNVIVPPCIPYPGSEVDPCSRRDTWEYHDPFVRITYQLPEIFPSLRDQIITGDSPAYLPQFIVRATVIPGSTRCGNTDFELWLVSSYNNSFNESMGRGKAYCFVELAVNEYLVGGGPARLTVNTTVSPCQPVGDEPDCDAETLKFGAESVQAIGIEGIEWIFSLGGPADLGTLAWDIVDRWDVQLRRDDEVVVVNRLKLPMLNRSAPGDFDTNLSRVEQTLDDFRSIVIDAHRDLVEMTQGRITTRTDVRGQPAARMALDAGPTGLSDFIFSTTSIERLNATPTSPPPIPGENDPNPAGRTVNDIIATRVAGGVRIPGGLEGTATPVSALGDEPTATATVEPTATATVEPTVTPEPVPTPEPEDTPTPEAEAAPTATPEPVPTPEPQPTATATPEPVVEPTATPELEPTATAESVVEPPSTATPEPVIEPTATPEDAVPTDTPEPEVPGPDGPGEVVPPGGEGPVGGGPDGPDTGSAPDG